MNQLTKYLIQELLENKQVIGLFGGGFKPPTKGHFEVVEQALEKYPELDKLIIYVGEPTRDGFPVTQEQSLIIWEIYKTLLGNKVEILPSPSPIGDIVRYGRDNPDQTVYFFLGEREGKKSDIIDIANRSKSVKGYPNIQVKVIKSPDTGISGTAARGILPNLEITLEDFKQFLPDKLSEDGKQLVYNLLKSKLSDDEKDQINNLLKKGAVNEIGEANTEPYEWEETNKGKYKIEVRFKTDSKIEYIVSLYQEQYLIDDYEGLKAIEVEFTAKSENDKYPSVTTVTNKGEMYRVMATITSIIKKYIEEYKIQAIIYSPSKKSDKEDDFNNQRDRLYREFISKAFPGAKYETSKQGRIAILPNVNEGTCGYDTNAETGEKLDTPGGISETGKSSPYGSGYKPLLLEISKFMINQGMEIQPLPKVQFIDDDTNNAQDILGTTAYYDPQSKTIVLYTLNRHPKDILRSFCHEMVHHEQNMKGTLGDIRTQNTTEDPHLDRIEREAYEKGNIMFRNWEDNYKKTWQLQILLVPSDYRVNRMNEDEREEENEGNPGGGKYTIYCDMDGVLCDFDKRFMEFSNGIPPSEYESKFGKKAFWELISKKGVGFWVGIPWMSDGKQLWDYIKPYNPSLLSAPSSEESSRLGKRLWVRNNIPGTKLILRQAEQKQEFANPNAILIDDRTSNIQQWIDKGGIGILHTSADETIKQLKEYGL